MSEASQAIAVDKAQAMQILEPEDDSEDWRYVDRKGGMRVFQPKHVQMAVLVVDTGKTTEVVASEMGVSREYAVQVLQYPHVRALVERLVELKAVQLKAAALATLHDLITRPRRGLTAAERARLSLKVMELDNPLGDVANSTRNKANAGQDMGAKGVHIHLGLPHSDKVRGEVLVGEAMESDEDKSKGV